MCEFRAALHSEMANLKYSSTFTIHNDYYTPKSAWANIVHLVPSDMVVYEAFLLNSNEQSKVYLTELGYTVIGDRTIDYLKDALPKESYDIVISNPPFERIKSFNKRHTNLKYRCIKKLIDTDKPFIILLNATNLNSKWFAELFEDKDIQFIFPKKKIDYDKYEEGGHVKIQQKKWGCSFMSVYVTYKIIERNLWV